MKIKTTSIAPSVLFDSLDLAGTDSASAFSILINVRKISNTSGVFREEVAVDIKHPFLTGLDGDGLTALNTIDKLVSCCLAPSAFRELGRLQLEERKLISFDFYYSQMIAFLLLRPQTIAGTSLSTEAEVIVSTFGVK